MWGGGLLACLSKGTELDGVVRGRSKVGRKSGKGGGFSWEMWRVGETMQGQEVGRVWLMLNCDSGSAV